MCCIDRHEKSTNSCKIFRQVDQPKVKCRHIRKCIRLMHNVTFELMHNHCNMFYYNNCADYLIYSSGLNKTLYRINNGFGYYF